MLRLILRQTQGFRRYSTEVAKEASKAPKIASSVPKGTTLTGINVRKAGEDPVALADEEYPAWLWEVLDTDAQKAKLASDPIKAARKMRREANRQKIKEHNFLAKMKAA